MKRFELCLLFGLVFTITLSCFDFSVQCSSIRDKVFRLHILANSDSEYDQNLKLKVRDRLLNEGLEIFCNSENLDETIKKATENIETFNSVAVDELKQNNCCYSVKTEVTDCYFNTRTYGNTTLPAGVYKALEVKIGNAEGHNWWCVMYPSLCLPESSQRIEDVLNTDETEIVENKTKYIAKFKIVELFETIKSYF